ncbi:hypothetical protein THTE_0327 [Thermogutta terrifontis]|uniref:Uncharacterized protein n=1 Tax=Thermogutta terrifontis TaxID=1331910 RepID=A0A286RAE8_9BACT|nr:hypothetical protein THTE_0327 [Thermogutta terrifontis]
MTGRVEAAPPMRPVEAANFHVGRSTAFPGGNCQSACPGGFCYVSLLT